MREITQQFIDSLAPNPAASVNGRKISQKGGFIRLERSEDDTFYLGECTGSGKSSYITSADFLEPAAPVFRCSCPSHQFPCKHSLALLYEIMAGKDFAVQPIPEDILQKRAKKEARAAKAAAPKEPDAPRTPPRVNKAARTKKLQKQLEGVELTEQLVRDLLNAGLGSMGGAALPTYRNLVKQLGDYYLPGPQALLNQLIFEISAFQNDGGDGHYEAAIDTLERLWALVKKSKQYLSQKLDSGDVGQDDSALFEDLGGVWKLDELAALGLCKENARLAQLAFWVSADEARNQFTDTGVWADLDTGEISVTCNYRPFKALKYIKQDDTVFGAVTVPTAVYYPGEGNRRIRWEEAAFGELTAADCAALRAYAAASLAAEARNAKNILKNTLSDPMLCSLLRFRRIGKAGDALVVQDENGVAVALGDMPGLEPTISRLSALPDAALLENQVLLGAFWYDAAERRLKIQPLSIVTDADVVRLLY